MIDFYYLTVWVICIAVTLLILYDGIMFVAGWRRTGRRRDNPYTISCVAWTMSKNHRWFPPVLAAVAIVLWCHFCWGAWNYWR